MEFVADQQTFTSKTFTHLSILSVTSHDVIRIQ